MKILISGFIVLFISSCATQKRVGKTAAERLYNDAKLYTESGRYLLALEKINIIRSQYPYSYYATPSELLQADILYKQESFTEAAAAYILFRDFHPKHKKIEYVLYRIGDSFFRQLPTTYDRDLAVTSDVIRYSSELIRKFPKSEYVKKAMDNIEKCKQMRRDKEQYIADFYFKTKVFDSAGIRYLSILDEYSDDKKWDYTKDLLLMAKWDIPTELQTRDIEVKSIKVVGVASTYGRNDGFAGQLTSSGKLVNSNTAALQMDLAHVLSDFGAVPFSMRGVKATLTMPDCRQITKNLEDKGGLVNYLGESYWRGALKNMKVDKNGVGVLAPLPASHYRVVDIFTQSQSTLIPNVAVEIHLKKPLLRKVDLTSKQRQAWMRSNFQEPGTSE